MSKVAEAKKEQGYVNEQRRCGTCEKIQFESIFLRNGKRCGIGGFVVNVNSSCDKYEKAK